MIFIFIGILIYVRLSRGWRVFSAAAVSSDVSWEFFGCLSDFFRGIEGWGVFIAIFFFSFYFLKRYSLRWCFGVATCVLFFAGGWLGITRQLQGVVYVFPEEEVVYRVKITDTPKAGERTLFCQVRIKEWRDSTGNFHPAGAGRFFICNGIQRQKK